MVTYQRRSCMKHFWSIGVALLASLLVFTGCQQLRLARFAPQPGGESTEMADGERPAVEDSADSIETALADTRWSQAPGRADAHWAAAGPHWRHGALDEYLSVPPKRQPAWSGYLNSSHPVIAANAAICLARGGGDKPVAQLEAIVLQRELSLPLRQAAAESLAFVEGHPAEEALGRLADQFAEKLAQGNSGYAGDLHAAVLRSLARHVVAAGEPRFADALESPSTEVKMAVLAAYARGGRGPLPTGALDLRYDPDPRIRGAALEAIAGCGMPDAVEMLQAALADYELSVRLTAIQGLGVLGRQEARPTLVRLMQSPGELVRVAAADALAMLGSLDDLAPAANDKSWRVRRVVADALGLLPYRDEIGERTVELLRNLLEDDSVDVETAAVATLAEWPREHAVPLLLVALDRSSYRARKDAAELLARHWPESGRFPVDAPADERSRTLADLRRRWGGVERAESSQAELANSGSQESAEPAEASHTEDDLVSLETLLARFAGAGADTGAGAQARAEVIAALDAYGDRLLPIVEELVLARRRPLPAFVYSEVLAARDPTFATIEQLASPDTPVRRRATATLVAQTAEGPLSPLALHRLAALAATENDPLVWHSIWQVIADEGAEPSILLAYAAIGHPAPEVRRKACEHLGRHPAPRHAAVLLPALDDPNPMVASAAVRALRHRGMLDDPAPLERLLAASDHHLRVDVAATLARNGAESGFAALERLAADGDPKVRVRVIQEMAGLGDPQFTPALMQLLDDNLLGVRHAALAALTEVVGHDVGRAADQPTPSLIQQIERWKAWWQKDGALSYNHTRVKS